MNRTYIRTIHLALVLLAGLFFCGTKLGHARNPNAEPQVIEIHARKFAYEPAEITVHKRQSYKLRLMTDDVAHSLRIKALNFNTVIKPGQPEDVPFTPEQVGDFQAAVASSAASVTQR